MTVTFDELMLSAGFAACADRLHTVAARHGGRPGGSGGSGGSAE